MSLSSLDPAESGSEGRRISGAVVARVTNNQDPDKLGRVRLALPWLSPTVESAWARIAAPLAGDGFGLCFLPEVGDEVLVLFEHGDVDYPFVIGALWSAAAKPPTDNGDGKNNLRLLRSRSGHLIQLDDSDGKEQIVIRDKSGKNQIIIDSAANTISVSADQDLTITVKGKISLEADGDIALQCKDFSVDAKGKASLQASQEIGIQCMAGVKINNDGLVVT